MTPRDPADFADEIASHLAHETDRLIATGMSPDDAAAAARRRFGNVTAHRERQWVASPRRTVQLRWSLAARRAWRTPGFSAAVITILGGAFATLTLVAAFVYNAELRPLPVRAAAALVTVWTNDDIHNPTPEQDIVPGDMLTAWRRGQHAFTSLTAYAPVRAKIADQFARETVGAVVDGNYFSTLGLRLALGRGVAPSDDAGSAAPVAVLSDAIWRSVYHADRHIVGTVAKINDTQYVIVGVTAPDANALGIPIWLSNPVPGFWSQDDGYYYVIGRLRADQTLATARAQLATMIPATAHGSARSPDRGVIVRSFADSMRSLHGQSLLLISAVVLLVLVAWINLGTLYVVRGLARMRQTAISLAMGATPGRLAADAALEGALLGAGAGVVAVTIAQALRVGMQSFISAHVTSSAERLPMPWFVDVGMIVAATVAGAVIAVAASAMMRRLDIAAFLHGGSDTASHRQTQWRLGLVAAQVSVAMLSVIAATRLVATVEYMSHIDVGFESDHLLVAELPIWDTPLGNDSTAQQLIDRLVPAVGATPGLGPAAAWATIGFRMPRGPDDHLVVFDGRDVNVSTHCNFSTCATVIEAVNDDLFHVFGVALRRGRAFGPADRAGPPVAIVNQQAQHAWFADADPIGQRIRVRGADSTDPWRTIVGVVANVAQFNPMARTPKMVHPGTVQPLIYVPLSQTHLQQAGLGMAYPVSIAVRPHLPRAQATTALRTSILAAAPDTPIQDVLRMTSIFDQGFAEAPARWNATVVSAVALITLLLALLGIGGAVAESARQRSRELGIRLALGGTRAHVTGIVCQGALRLAIGGAAIGAMVALAGETTLAKVAFGGAPQARPHGAWLWGPDRTVVSFIIASAIILAVALLAALIPALRAARLDPATVLRAGAD